MKLFKNINFNMFGKHKTLILHKYKEKKRSLFPDIIAGQWSQIFAGILCCLGFCFIFSTMIYLTLQSIENNTNGSGAPLNISTLSHNAGNGNTTRALCVANACGAVCTNSIENLSVALDEIFGGAYCPIGITLVIKGVSMPNQTIQRNWLSSTKIKIFHLQFEWLYIDRIEPGAFTDNPFVGTKYLYMGFCEITRFQNESFQGLNDLIELNIWDSTIRFVERNALVGLSNNIVYMSFRNCQVNVYDLLVDMNFPKLLTLVLTSTTLSKIQTNIFHGLKVCSSLMLESCSINEIEDGSFNFVRNLMRLHLDYNNLQTLPRNLFSSTRLQRLYIKGNDWLCICDITWIKDLILLDDDFDITYCKGPINLMNSLFSEAEFCQSGNTTSTTLLTTDVIVTTPSVGNDTDDDGRRSSTDDAHIPTQPYDESKYINITCKSLSSYEAENIKAPYYFKSYKIMYENVPYIKIVESADNVESIVVEANPAILTLDVLIWYEIQDKKMNAFEYDESLLCLTNFNSTKVAINNLHYGKKYMFCLLRNRNSFVYPFDCKPHLVEVHWNKKAWLKEKDKPFVIGFAIVMTIVCGLCGAGFVYIIIRRNPVLLRGSKRVVMVKNNATKAIVLPSNCTNDTKNYNKAPEPVNIKPSLENRRRNFKRSVSETSIVSSKSATVSYVSALEPTPVQLLHWRLERLRGGTGALMEASDISPPPSLISIPTIQGNSST